MQYTTYIGILAIFSNNPESDHIRRNLNFSVVYDLSEANPEKGKFRIEIFTPAKILQPLDPP
jgi:hypothetical protein